jgi:hypothetical protein
MQAEFQGAFAQTIIYPVASPGGFKNGDFGNDQSPNLESHAEAQRRAKENSYILMDSYLSLIGNPKTYQKKIDAYKRQSYYSPSARCQANTFLRSSSLPRNLKLPNPTPNPIIPFQSLYHDPNHQNTSPGPLAPHKPQKPTEISRFASPKDLSGQKNLNLSESLSEHVFEKTEKSQQSLKKNYKNGKRAGKILGLSHCPVISDKEDDKFSVKYFHCKVKPKHQSMRNSI